MNTMTFASVVDTMKTTTNLLVDKVPHEETKDALNKWYATQFETVSGWAAELDKATASAVKSLTKFGK